MEGWGKGSSQTPYILEVKLLCSWDNSQEFEPNDDPEQANSIKLGQTIKGFTQPDDDEDWYSFSIPESGKDILIIRISAVDNIDHSLTLLNEEEKELKEINIEEEGKGEIIVRMRVPPGKYYLKVASWGINPDTLYELHLGEKPRSPATPQEVKQALEKALDYLAAEQAEEGCWNGKYGENAGVAGLCLMALVGGECAGKDYRTQIERAIGFLKNKYHPSSDYKTPEKKDYYGGLIGESELMYEHGIATLALIEAMAALNKWDLEPIINEAVQLLLRTQNTEHKPKTLKGPVDSSSPNYGGWRYDPDSTDSDISVSGWQILALKAAQMAGFEIPEWSTTASVKFLHSCYNDEYKYFTYEPEGDEGCVRAGIGALCLRLLGQSSDPRIKSAIRYMFNNPPTWIYEDPGEGYPFYYWYYGTRVMLDQGGTDWKLWKSWMCRLLVDHQSDDGSWESKQDEKDMPYYTTALGALMLELCCGHVPIYMRKEIPSWGYIQVRQEGKAASKIFKNIELVLDASNSMWGQISGGSKISIAKKTLQQIISSLPEDINVGLRVYGHRFPLQDRRAYRDTEQLVTIGPLNKSFLIETINNLQPKGKTPLVFSVLEAIKDFAGQKEGSIILITDGIESCGGDIRSIESALKKSNIELNLNIVGFAIKEDKARRELESIAKEAGGIYLDARNTKELVSSLQQTLQMPFEILNPQKEVVARGLVGGEAIRLRQGNYWLRFKIGSQTIEEKVEVVGHKTITFWLKKEGDRWLLKRDLRKTSD